MRNAAEFQRMSHKKCLDLRVKFVVKIDLSNLHRTGCVFPRASSRSFALGAQSAAREKSRRGESASCQGLVKIQAIEDPT